MPQKECLLLPPAAASQCSTLSLAGPWRYQVARVGVFIADRFRFAHRQSGVQIHMPQKPHPIPVEDRRQRRLRKAQVVADPVRSLPPGEAQSDDPPLRAPGRLGFLRSCSQSRHWPARLSSRLSPRSIRESEPGQLLKYSAASRGSVNNSVYAVLFG